MLPLISGRAASARSDTALRCSNGIEKNPSGALVCMSTPTTRSYASGTQHVGDEPRADWFTAVRAPILARVAEVRNDCRQPLGACPSAGVRQEQQLQQVLRFWGATRRSRSSWVI